MDCNVWYAFAYHKVKTELMQGGHLTRKGQHRQLADMAILKRGVRVGQVFAVCVQWRKMC